MIINRFTVSKQLAAFPRPPILNKPSRPCSPRASHRIAMKRIFVKVKSLFSFLTWKNMRDAKPQKPIP